MKVLVVAIFFVAFAGTSMGKSAKGRSGLAPSGIGKPVECYRPHEYYSCGSACQTACATLGEPCMIINIKCNDGCYCQEGYARDANLNCIPVSQCPAKCN